MNLTQWERTKEIFHAAMDLPTRERDRFVRTRCGDDLTLLDEVNSLLLAHSESGAFIEAPAFRPISSFVDDRSIPHLIGKMVGPYMIEKEIGRGGMGAVYLATRADAEFEKRVAIKLIKRGYDTDEIVSRFRTERQILAGLDHPNITRLLDGGSTEEGRPYFVMEYVEGEPLNVYCDRRHLTTRERLELFLQICSAVSYAHQQLVIHRDLKPSNILITSDGRPKLLDFGVARLTAPTRIVETETVEAVRALTPDYASPEQIRGGRATMSSDVYSLGVILYELLTGHKPYNVRGKRADEIERILSATSPLKPSAVCVLRGTRPEIGDPLAVARTLRGDLDRIVFMAMRMETDRRYSSVEQFADDIGRHLVGLPVLAHDDSLGYRTAKFVGRNKAGVAAGVGIMSSLLIGLFAAGRQAKKAARERDRAKEEAATAEKVNRFLRNMLASADPRNVGRDLRVVEVLESTAERVNLEFARQPEIASDLNATIGLTYLGLGQLEPAGRHLRSALETRLRHFPDGSAPVAVSLRDYGKYLYARGDLDGAETCYLDAMRVFQSQRGAESDLADVMENLGALYGQKGDLERAVTLLENGLKLRRELLGDLHPQVGRHMSRLASVHSLCDRHDEAERLHWKALRILLKVHRGDHPDIAYVMTGLVREVNRREPGVAEQLCREALAIRRRLLGDEHPDVAWSLYNLANILFDRGKLDDAESVIAEALAKRGSNVPDGHPLVSSCLLLSGRLELARGRIEAACEHFNTCLELRRQSLPPDHWLIAITNTYIAECHIRLGDRERGQALLAENYDLLVQKLGPDHEQTRQVRRRMDALAVSAAAAN